MSDNVAAIILANRFLNSREVSYPKFRENVRRTIDKLTSFPAVSACYLLSDCDNIIQDDFIQRKEVTAFKATKKLELRNLNEVLSVFDNEELFQSNVILCCSEMLGQLPKEEIQKPLSVLHSDTATVAFGATLLAEQDSMWPHYDNRGPVWRDNRIYYALKTRSMPISDFNDLSSIVPVPICDDLSSNNILLSDSFYDADRQGRRLSNGRAPKWPEKISCIVFDFDGVLTDNLVSVDLEGREFVSCSRGDGMGIEKLRKLGLPLLVLSKEKNTVVSARCEKLQIPCLQGIDEKKAALKEWFARNNISAEHFIYVGNDENDIECLEWASFAVVPADAHHSTYDVADIVLSKEGGKGAVRELCDHIFMLHGSQVIEII